MIYFTTFYDRILFYLVIHVFNHFVVFLVEQTY